MKKFVLNIQRYETRTDLTTLYRTSGIQVLYQKNEHDFPRREESVRNLKFTYGLFDSRYTVRAKIRDFSKRLYISKTD